MRKEKSKYYYNSEGYPDPTAFSVIKEETDTEKRVALLIRAIKTIVTVSGFELLNRIEIRDEKSGRIFR